MRQAYKKRIKASLALLLALTMLFVMLPLSITTNGSALASEPPLRPGNSNNNPGGPSIEIPEYNLLFRVSGNGANLVLTATRVDLDKTITLPTEGNGTFHQIFNVFGFTAVINVQGNSLISVVIYICQCDCGFKCENDVCRKDPNCRFCEYDEDLVCICKCTCPLPSDYICECICDFKCPDDECERSPQCAFCETDEIDCTCECACDDNGTGDGGTGDGDGGNGGNDGTGNGNNNGGDGTGDGGNNGTGDDGDGNDDNGTGGGETGAIGGAGPVLTIIPTATAPAAPTPATPAVIPPETPPVTIPDPPPPFAPAPPTVTEPDESEEQADDEDDVIITIPEQDVPLAPFSDGQSWSFMNLILSLAGSIMSLMIGFHILMMKKKESEGVLNGVKAATAKSSRFFLALATPALAISGLVLFILTQDMRLPMRMVDWYTPAHAAIFFAGAQSYIYACRINKDDDDNQPVTA